MQFIIEDMTCAGCIANIEKAIKASDSLSKVEADLENHQISVHSELSEHVIREALAAAGYPAT